MTVICNVHGKKRDVFIAIIAIIMQIIVLTNQGNNIIIWNSGLDDSKVKAKSPQA